MMHAKRFYGYIAGGLELLYGVKNELCCIFFIILIARYSCLPLISRVASKNRAWLCGRYLMQHWWFKH